jgi:hypothetical protein
MSRGRDWMENDPVKYFEEHYAGKITTRGQLQQEDHGLYLKLCKLGKLEDVLPDAVYRDFSKVDPVDFFKEYPAGRIKTRGQLKKEDGGLYLKLRKLGKLEELLPDVQEKRDWSKIDPVKFFEERYAGKITTRGQLKKEDRGLYDKLRTLGKLDVVFPSDDKKQLEDLMDDFGGAQ